MKTAISIPNHVFKAAERAARELGLSRSEFYARAVAAYVKACLESDVTSKLNEVYADNATHLDPLLLAMQASSLAKEDW